MQRWKKPALRISKLFPWGRDIKQAEYWHGHFSTLLSKEIGPKKDGDKWFTLNRSHVYDEDYNLSLFMFFGLILQVPFIIAILN